MKTVIILSISWFMSGLIPVNYVMYYERNKPINLDTYIVVSLLAAGAGPLVPAAILIGDISNKCVMHCE